MRFEATIAPLNVLVADDDDAMRELMVESLRADGHHVVEAYDGVDLMHRLGEALDDPSRGALVVVTDVVMPNLSGLGVLATLRRTRRQVPVILVTALADDSVRTVAERLGAVTVFRKPLDIDDLRTAVLNAKSGFEHRLEERWHSSTNR